jgi:hypothetical protein
MTRSARVLTGVGVFLGLAAIGAFLPEQPSSALGGATGTPKLALLSTRGGNAGNYHTAEGEVRNLTDKPLARVVAVTSWN